MVELNIHCWNLNYLSYLKHQLHVMSATRRHFILNMVRACKRPALTSYTSESLNYVKVISFAG